MPQMTGKFGLAAMIAAFALIGCSDPHDDKKNFNPETGKHIAGWVNPDLHGASAKRPFGTASGFASCTECHNADFSGGISKTPCFTCHGASAPHPAAPWRGARTHATTDESNAPICANCHANGTNSAVQPSPAAAAGTPAGCFNGTLCHYTPGHPAGWNLPDAHGTSAKSQPSGFSLCQTCHGTDFAGGAATTCLNTAGCHGVGVNSPHSPTPWRTSAGSARTHTDTNTGNASVCGQCHAMGALLTSVPVPTNLVAGPPYGCFSNTLCHGQVGHTLGWAAPAQHGASAKSLPSVTNMTGFSTCQTCHGANFAGGTAVTCLNTAGCHGVGVNSPHAQSPWLSSVSSTMTHTTTNAANADTCGLCHWNNRTPPSYITPVPGTPNCTDNTLCHGAVPLGCVDCHASQRSAPNASILSGGTVTQRRDIVAEFALTWSHKRSAGGAVTNEDCIVCHMEGNATAKTRDAAYHGNGYIDLRDSDTGAHIQGVTWNNGTPGTYVSSGASASFIRYSRNLSVAFENDPNWLAGAAIQINLCLNCHDADGALSANARVTGGTALKPFNTTITGQTAPYNSNGNGNVVNVNEAFATTNASYHPVAGRANNSYVQGTRAVAPWNMVKTNGTTTSWGFLMSCGDCHAAAGATGVQTSTVTAHGGGATLRAPVYAGGNTAATNLCVICHATTYATTAANHGAGSAFATGGSSGNMPASMFANCYNCHAYTTAVGGTVTAITARPLRAENVHGFNDRTPGIIGSTWTTSGVRPFAFIRNTLSVWAPATVAGAAPTGAHTCTGTGGTCNNNMNNSSYTPGGTY